MILGVPILGNGIKATEPQSEVRPESRSSNITSKLFEDSSQLSKGANKERFSTKCCRSRTKLVCFTTVLKLLEFSLIIEVLNPKPEWPRN